MLTTRQERNEQRKISLFAWLGIALMASLLTLALNWPAWAQERNQLTFCDTQDEITAATIYGDGAVTIINAKIPQACNTFIGTYIKGNTVETIRGFGKLWDVTPVLVYAVGQHMQRVRPMEQWVSLASPLIEATWVPSGNDREDYIRWFEHAETTDAAFNRFGWKSCCSHSDRFVTTFRQDKDEDKWYFKKDGKWVEIPDFIIHHEVDPKMPEQLRSEGVLFIYQVDGKLTCFWPPETGG